MDFVIDYYNYIVVILIMMLGLWAMIAKRNLVQKCIGMAIAFVDEFVCAFSETCWKHRARI